jgi:hypothetical protein
VRHHRQQLDVREAHVARVGGELVGQLEVGERAVALERVQPPRAEVDLVDDIGSACGSDFRRCSSHFASSPPMLRHVHDRRGVRRHLRGERERVGLQLHRAVRLDDLELVALAGLGAFDHGLPDTGVAQVPHRGRLPVVEVADDRDRARVRRPTANDTP